MEEQKTNNLNKKEHDFRNIVLTFLGVFVILAAVSGGTFAYYAFSATNNTTITGTAATASLTLAITKVAPTTSGPLVPQLESTINSAIKGWNNTACVDKNTNKVCQIYSITVTNDSTATATVGATLTFNYATGSAFQNLRWAVLSGVPTSSSTKANSTNVPVMNTSYTYWLANGNNTSGVTNTRNKIGTATLGDKNSSTKTVTWYVVVWINETGSAQDSTDKGTFTGVVDVTDSSGKGLTSAFTSS